MKNSILPQSSRGSWIDAFDLDALSSLGVFFLVFAWSLAAGLFIQLVMLPALPNLHAGHGLLKGGDWIRFHHDATKLAELMQNQGWSAWELRPQGNAPIGIAAAFYSLAGISEPWVLLPINAAIFSLSAVFLYGIFSALAPRRFALIALLPFVVFPSAALIYSQIQKDVFSIAGTFAIVYVWITFTQAAKLQWSRVLCCVFCFAKGCLLIWVVRPYLLQPLMAASLLVVLMLIVLTGRGRDLIWWIGVFLCLLVMVGYNSPLVYPFSSFAPIEANIAPNIAIDPGIKNATSTQGAKRTSAASNYLEKTISKLNVTRIGFAEGYPQAGSNIDTDVRFDSVASVVSYIPRAFQVGLMAPFPSSWFVVGVSPGSEAMRFISGMEMAVSYFLLIGVALLFYQSKNKQTALLVVMLMVLILMLALVLVVSNIGTLYRMRYGTWQLLNGLGVLGWELWWLKRTSSSREK